MWADNASKIDMLAYNHMQSLYMKYLTMKE